MGNLLSQFENDVDKIISAPSGEYTVSPATVDAGVSSPDASGNTNNNKSSSESSNSDNKCVKPNPTDSATTTIQTNITSSPVPENQVNRNNEDDDNEFLEFIKTIFNATTYTIVFWIITVYIFYVLGKSIYANKGVGNESSGVARYSRTVDIVILFLFFAFLFSAYYKLDEEDKKNIFGYTIEWTQNYFNNPWSLFELIWFTIIFFALVYLLKVPMIPDAKPILVHLIEHKIWIIYALFAIIFFFKYALGIPIIDLLFNNSVMNYFKDVQPYSSSPGSTSGVFDDINQDLSLTTDVYNNRSDGTTTNTTNQDVLDNLLNTSPESDCVSDKQVFNVSNNLYTYEEAQKVCSAFDASLASYDQIEQSYANGAEWCNYGWSDGQMAFFPTQKQTWEDLQENPKTKNICGRPGINGGYIENPYVRFGANCYGIKPEQPDDWKPVSYVSECEIKKEDPNKKIRDGARLNSFNQKNWSRY